MNKVPVIYFPKTSKNTVLIIDDDEIRHKAIEAIYKPCGWTVYNAYNSRDAIEIIADLYEYGERFEVIHFDHDLRGKDTTIDVAEYMERYHIPCRKAIIHSRNPVGSENLRRILANMGVKAVKIPFRSN